jgi:uncharacterized protein Veg
MNCFVGVKKREKVMLMATKEVLAEIKQDLETFIGTRVKLKSFKGRNKVVEREGVLERTYPNIFASSQAIDPKYMEATCLVPPAPLLAFR